MSKKIFSVVFITCFMFPLLVGAEEATSKNVTIKTKTKTLPRVTGSTRSALSQKQKIENEMFRKSLEGKTPQEKAELTKAHNEEQFKERKDFSTEQHKKNLEFLKARIAGNKDLSDEQKNELITAFDSQYQQDAEFNNKEHSDNVAFFDKIANDTTMTQEQKKQAIRAHFLQKKQERKQYLKEQHKETFKKIKDATKVKVK